MSTEPKVCLTIAGSDGSSGAGIQADIRTFQALGCFPVSVLTSITIQNNQAFHQVIPLSKDQIVQQALVLIDEYKIHSIKIGLIPSMEAAKAVETILQHFRKTPVILDPILQSSSGHHFWDSEMSAYMIENVFPLVTLLTPNIPEISDLFNLPRNLTLDKKLFKHIVASFQIDKIIIKGGHTPIKNFCIDYYFDRSTNTLLHYKAKKIVTNNTHGTGCIFSSALCAFIAKDGDICDAFKKAHYFVNQVIQENQFINLSSTAGPALINVPHYYLTEKS